MNVQLSDSGLWRTLSSDSFIRVLIVDDNPADRYLYRRHLSAVKEHHYDVTESSSATEARDILSRDDFDCILLDYRLPGSDGIDFLAALQESRDTAFIPVIMVTGEGDENLAVRCLRKGAVDYVPKDKISSGVFKRAIGNAIVQADMKRTIEDQNRSLSAANQQLRTRNEEIQRFYHTVSHEIKTPLTATREFISIVLDGLVGEITEEQREVLSHARESCDDMATQFHDLVDCTRAETGKLRIKTVRCSVEAMVQRSVAAVSPGLKSGNIKLELKLEPNLPEVFMDGRRMVQVLSNLLSNAVKHTEPGGKVIVFAGKKANELHFGVQDTGCGIAEEHLPRIFDRLFQVTESGDELCGVGLGLGLAIAREIVSLHDGNITVKSKLGVGSRFTVQLPLASTKQNTLKEIQTS